MSKKHKKGKKRKCNECGFLFTKKDLTVDYKNFESYELDALPCPSCGVPYPTKPETERNLFLLQEQYYEKGRDPLILKEIEDILISYSSSIIKKKFIKGLNGIFEIERYARISASRIIYHYVERDEYRIYASFGGLLAYKIKEVLYEVSNRFMGGKGDRYGVMSLDSITETYDGNENQEFFIKESLPDVRYEQEFEKDLLDEKDALLDKIEKILDEDYVYDGLDCLMYETEYLDILRLIAFNLFINQKEDKLEEFFTIWGCQTRKSFLETVDKFRNVLI